MTPAEWGTIEDYGHLSLAGLFNHAARKAVQNSGFLSVYADGETVAVGLADHDGVRVGGRTELVRDGDMAADMMRVLEGIADGDDGSGVELSEQFADWLAELDEPEDGP